MTKIKRSVALLLAVLMLFALPAYGEEVRVNDDFYSAVNAEYLANTTLAEGQHYTSPSTLVEETINDRLNGLSLDLVADYQAGNIPDESAMDIEAAKLYLLALESDRTPGAGLGEVEPLLQRVQSCQTLKELAVLNGELIREYGIPILFNVSAPYAERAYTYTPFGTELKYLSAGYGHSFWEEVAGSRESYIAYIRRLLDLMSVYFETPVPADMAERAADFQIEIDKFGPTLEEELREARENRDNPDAIYDTDYGYTLSELTARYGELCPLIDTINAISPNGMSFIMQEFVIYDIDAMDKTLEKLAAADTDILKAICSVNLIEGFMNFLPRPYREAGDEFTYSVFAADVAGSSEDYATAMAAALYPESYERRYLEKYAKDLDTAPIISLIKEITAGFKDKFRGSPNLSASTKVKAITKLSEMAHSVAEVNRAVPYFYSYYTIPEGCATMTALGTDFYSSRTGLEYCINTPMPCYIVNATYDTYKNLFTIYAGILSHPLYDPNASEEEILANVGFTIAHEISHAFDEVGSLYDSAGRYSRWWNESDRKKYVGKVLKLADIYSAHTTLGGNHINGELTSNENIADILAMDCIITVAKENGLDLDALFRAYARSWAEVRSPRYDLYTSKFEVHSDGRTRVNAVLSNFDEFYEVYGITEGDGMYVAPENRIKLI